MTGGCVKGIDQEGPCDSTEPGCKGCLWMLAQLLDLLGNAWQAFLGAVLEITCNLTRIRHNFSLTVGRIDRWCAGQQKGS